jgi:hypothetical protein
MAGPKASVEYTSDNGSTYKMKMDGSNAAAVGGEPASDSLADVPRRMRPRYVLAQHPTTGVQRKIVIPTVDHPLWPVSGGTLTIDDFSVRPSSITTAYLVKGRIGEKRYA